MGLIKDDIWSGNPKQKRKIKTLWHGDDVAQLEHSKNKYYDSAFRYIHIYNKQETNHMCNCLLLREREREIVLESLILLFHPLDCSPNLAHTY